MYNLILKEKLDIYHAPCLFSLSAMFTFNFDHVLISGQLKLAVYVNYGLLTVNGKGWTSFLGDGQINKGPIFCVPLIIVDLKKKHKYTLRAVTRDYY